MKSYRKELFFNTTERYQIMNITSEVEDCLSDSGIQEGLCLVNAMHITASVFVTEAEDAIHQDHLDWLEGLAPYKRTGYRHNIGQDNGDGHLKRQILGRETVVAVTGGKLDLGTWENICYGEFDGRRKKRVLVKIIGE